MLTGDVTQPAGLLRQTQPHRRHASFLLNSLRFHELLMLFFSHSASISVFYVASLFRVRLWSVESHSRAACVNFTSLCQCHHSGVIYRLTQRHKAKYRQSHGYSEIFKATYSLCVLQWTYTYNHKWKLHNRNVVKMESQGFPEVYRHHYVGQSSPAM